jgi:branched-chain amino acid transport system substrate-binding protein
MPARDVRCLYKTLWRGTVKKFLMILAMLASLSLVAAACGSDDADTATEDTTTTAAADTGTDDTTAETTAETTADTEAMEETDFLGDGSLGVVTVEPGAEIQIRSLNAITGDVAFLGVPNQRAVEQAVVDYGSIKGFDVTSGTGLDDLCSADGGQAAAQTIVADEQVIGVIGTSCSGAATAAAPLISAAGMVMISGSNTSPALTSDQQGNAGDNYNVGYYRTAHNDLFQGAAMAEFVFNELGLASVAGIHDGDPYTEGLATAFANAFEALGGTVTAISGVAKEDTDMVPVLTEIAAGAPEAIFFPIFQPAGDFIADQAGGVSGLEDTVLLAADGLLVDGFMELPQSEGIRFSGPDVRFGANINESTGVSADEFLATYDTNNGEAPSAAFWGHSYDASAMLLDAIDAASHVNADGNLEIDRAGVREHLNSIQGYAGIIGTINCDDFGDCGSQKITIVEHLDSGDIEASKANVVFEYAPQ